MIRVRAFNSKLDKAKCANHVANFVLSKTPLGALHCRVCFRRTVTYIDQAFEYSLDYQHVVRSSGNRDIRHFRPILSHTSLSASLSSLSERILRLTILLVSRNCQSVNPVSKVFEAFLYSSVRNKWTCCCSSCIYETVDDARK